MNLKSFLFILILFFLSNCSARKKISEHNYEVINNITKWERTGMVDTVVVNISGLVFDLKNNKGLLYSTVRLFSDSLGYLSQSDSFGNFKLSNIKHGQYKVSVTTVGYKRIDTLIKLLPGDTWVWNIGLERSNMKVEF